MVWIKSANHSGAKFKNIKRKFKEQFGLSDPQRQRYMYNECVRKRLDNGFLK